MTTLLLRAFLLLVHAHLLVALPVFKDYSQFNPSLSPSNKIDIDQRSIVAKTALVSSTGLEQAKQIYTVGSTGGSPTLQSLSTDIYQDFDLFKAAAQFYGGDPNYADRWIQAALGGTAFSADANFLRLEWEGRSSAVRWGTVVLNVWMAVVSYLEKALKVGCTDGKYDDAETDWDTAFAYYTGSLAESEHPLGGYLLYNFAQIQCQQFGTCPKGQEAPVNTEILSLFVKGRQEINQRGKTCNSQKQTVSRLQALLTVPLVQACLKTTYALDLQGDVRQETQGEAAAFGAAVAPIVSRCSSGRADIIVRDTSPGNAPLGSFEVVKDALERSYDCLGITCQDVGGLTNVNGEYFSRAEACGNVKPVEGSSGVQGYYGSSSSGTSSSSGGNQANTAAAVVIVIALIVVLAMATVLLHLCLNNRRSKKEVDIAEFGLEKEEGKGAVDVEMLPEIS